MSGRSQYWWGALRGVASNPALMVICIAAVVLGVANAALLSVVHTYVPPHRLATVATDLLAAVNLVRMLLAMWLGIHPLC